MAERLVDVLNPNQTVLHTYPVTIEDAAVADAAYEAKAAAAAAFDRLVPDAALTGLTTRMHVSRGGALAPYGDDDRGGLAETKHGLNEVVRELAFCLWQQDGCPEGRADEYWYRARDQRLRERAYVLWQQNGSPPGRADEFWQRTCEFEAC